MAIYNEIRGYIGTSGSGKSYTMVAHLLEKMRDDPSGRIVLIDHKRGARGFGEYADLPLHYVICDQDILALLHPPLWEEILQRYPRLRIQPLGLTYDEMILMSSQIAGAISRIGNTTFIIEEAYIYLPLTQKNEEIQRLATGGRTSKINLWFVIQRPAMFDTTVFSQLHSAYIFRLSDVNDLKRISSICQGVSPSEISGLQRTEYIFFDLVRGTHEKRFQKKIPEFIHYG